MRAVAALVVVLLVPGCGSAPGPDRAAYLARAEAVCSHALEARRAVPQPRSVAEVPGSVERRVAVDADAAARLAALDPPADDVAELRERFLAPLAGQVREGRSYARLLRATARRGDPAAVLRLLAAAPTETRVDLDFLRAYGFSACVDAADASPSLD